MNIKELNNRLMYTDKVDLYRYTKVKNLDNSTTQKLNIVPDMQDVACKLDVKTPDSPETVEDVNSLKVIYTLFTDNSHDFKKGDFLEVTRLGKKYKLQAGKPIVHAFHQQIPCIEKEWA